MEINKNIPSKYFADFKASLPNVRGKVFVITGTTSGTGFVAARTVAEKGGRVICLNRPSQRVKDSTAKLREAVPSGVFVNIDCDLSDFDSVQGAADDIKSSYPSLYCLCFNAGMATPEDKATKDGCDFAMQVNHLSHFLLAKELYPLLQAEAERIGDARIVFHSSDARNMTKNGLEKQYFEKRGGNLGGHGLLGKGSIRYAQTKLANSVMMHAMHEKLQEKGSKIRSIACHPGGAATSLGDNMNVNWFLKSILVLVLNCMVQSAEDGTMGLLKAMMDPEAESGVLYGPKRTTGLAIANPPKPYETDPDAMKMLWETSEETTDTKFVI